MSNFRKFTPGPTVAAKDVEVGDLIYASRRRSTNEPALPATVLRARVATGPWSAGLILLTVQIANQRRHAIRLRPMRAERTLHRAIPAT